MKELKKLSLRIFLILEVLVLTSLYLFGSRGLQALKKNETENHQLATDIINLEREISQIQEELDDRNANPFYKRRIAFEELQMAEDDIEIYPFIEK